jgi:hypothetical protein
MVVPLLLGCVVFAGCDSPPTDKKIPSGNPEDLAKCLPEGVTLTTPLTPGSPTVGDKLRELGARAKDGKLYDFSGKEIYIYRRFVPGANPGDKILREQARQEEEELERLRQKYTLIVITTFGV